MSRRAPSEPGPLAGYLFMAPALLVLMTFVVVPVLAAIGLSFTSWNVVGPVRPVGLRNYALMATDPTFARSVANTLVYTAASTALGIAGALGLALLVAERLPGTAAFRVLLFVPAVLSDVITAMVWQWLYNTDVGIINYLLGLAGLPHVPWLTSTHWAMVSVVLMGAWVGAAYNTPILLAGLESIPGSLVEAARMDGAGSWQVFWHVRLPLLRPFILYSTVMAVIGSFQVFGRIHVLTGGGPVDSTLVAVQYIYRVAFSYNQMGYASALSVAVFALLVGLTWINMRLAGDEVR